MPGSGGSDNHGSVLAGHIADAMLHYVNQTAVQNLMKRPVQLALIGAGNIRAPLAAGEVREGNIRLEVLPFDTPLSVLSISGAELRALLTDIVSQSVVTGAHTGKFPYVAGIRYVAKQTGPTAAELTTLDIKQDGSWQAVEPQQRYSLVTTSYLADGNDGWQLLQQLQAEFSYSGGNYLGNFAGQLQGPAGAFSLSAPFSGDLQQVALPQLQLVAGQGRAEGVLKLGFAAGIDWQAMLQLSAPQSQDQFV